MPKGPMKKPTKKRLVELLQETYWDLERVIAHNQLSPPDSLEVEAVLEAYGRNHPPGTEEEHYVIATIADVNHG